MDNSPLMYGVNSVKRYSYRTAKVAEQFLQFPLDGMMKDLHSNLANLSGLRPENHTVYEITKGDGKIYVSFSDYTVTFGFAIDEGRW